MTNLWEVIRETRISGSIGVFTPRTYTIRASTVEQAIDWALEDAISEGWECRNLISAIKVS